MKFWHPALLACALTACKGDSAPPIRIMVGPGPSDQATLVPAAALAEYIEISPDESVLLLTLSSAQRGCDAAAPPPSKDEVGVSVRLSLPRGKKLEAGTFPILNAGPDESSPRTSVTVKLGGKRHELRPGGELELRELDLGPRGALSGLLKLEAAGDAEHPATRVAGQFLAHFCRINRLR
jgi:hypothetical protein